MDPLIKNEDLKSIDGLTEEQTAAIARLVENKYASAIATKTQTHAQAVENDVLGLFPGLEKKQGEKYYELLKRPVIELQDKYKAAEEVLKAKDKEIKDLNDQVTAKGDLAVNKVKDSYEGKLRDANQLVADLKSQNEKLKGSFSELKQTHSSELEKVKSNNKDILVNAQFEAAYNQFLPHLKEGIPEGVARTVFEKAISKSKAAHENYGIEDMEGKATLMFRNAEGVPVTDPNNGHQPITPNAMLLKHGMKDILKEDRIIEGGGQGKAAASKTVNIGAASTQKDAFEAIHATLAEKGKARSDDDYSDTFSKIVEENNVMSLPTA